MDEYKPGDVVILNSGGPAMTVVESGNNVLSCVWFSSEDTVWCKQFDARCVQRVGVQLIDEPVKGE